ncbi:MAG TPA: hypothetical protein DCF84_01965 [Bacteroidetes bacterium]|nr:hypothetical protein [Bacteroidota bacterium]
MESWRIALVGSGRMAHNLSEGFIQNGHVVSHLIARQSKKAKALSLHLDAQWVSFENLQQSSLQQVDIIVLAVSDDVIEEISSQFSDEVQERIPIVHTSASTPMESLKFFQRFGVFYPFQTMTIGRNIVWNEVPILIEAHHKDLESRLMQLAATISTKAQIMSHTQRKALHLAGVYVNNFTNHLVNLAQDYLEEHTIDPSLTHALVQETMLKVLDIGPKQAQTGPAIRGDEKTIAAHLAELQDKEKLAQIYKQLSESIRDHNK